MSELATKRRFAIAAAVSVAVAVVAAPATASIPFPTRITCPTDGRVVETWQVMAYSTWGERPDGKPYGSAEFPLPLVECADGLVMYENEFGAEAAARLRPLVASLEYSALGAAGHSSYYRAYWLMRQMEEPAHDQLAFLVQAIWQTDDRPELRRLYLRELLDRHAESQAVEGPLRLALRARAINALRELGRFDEASAMIRSTSFDAAAVRLQRREVRAWRRVYRQLAALVARRDTAIEPKSMIPRRETTR